MDQNMTKDRCIVYLLTMRYRENIQLAESWKEVNGEDDIHKLLLAQMYESWNILESSRRILYGVEL